LQFISFYSFHLLYRSITYGRHRLIYSWYLCITNSAAQKQTKVKLQKFQHQKWLLWKLASSSYSLYINIPQWFLLQLLLLFKHLQLFLFIYIWCILFSASSVLLQNDYFLKIYIIYILIIFYLLAKRKLMLLLETLFWIDKCSVMALFMDIKTHFYHCLRWKVSSVSKWKPSSNHHILVITNNNTITFKTVNIGNIFKDKICH